MKRRRNERDAGWIAVLMVAALLAGAWFGFGSNSAAVHAEKSGENDDSTLIVGFDASFPPYGYQDDSGEYVGFDLDLAQEVCKRNGWT